MKDYLLRFRSQAFEGAMSLFKRILLPNFILSIIITLVALALIMPLALQAFGMSVNDLVNFSENMKDFSEKAQKGEDVNAMFMNMFGSFNLLFIFLMIIVGLIIYSWMFNTYLQLNDNEIRNRDNSFIHALSKSFSKKTFTILGYILLYSLINLVVVIIFISAMALLIKAASFIGGLLAFILFFVVIIFMLRFSLGFPAIVHGNMSVSQALAFSYKHLTWKRTALVFLISIILFIVLVLISMIVSLITLALVNKETSGSLTYLIINQILGTITSAIIGSFIYASLSTLYFRYSDDEAEEEMVDRHFVPEA